MNPSLPSLWLVYNLCFVSGQVAITDEESCSRKCESGAPEEQKNGTVLPHPCSCTSSCINYGDCCKDTPFRYETKKSPNMICLSLSGRGSFRAISRCPKEWTESSQFCIESIGYLPPATSSSSGNTYANVYCAICHGDSENLKPWNTDLRCCSELDDEEEDPERRYVYRKGQLWSRSSRSKKCLCKYYARENDTSFLDNLELRTCDRRFEVSECSSSWGAPALENLCKSFLDPVYAADTVYRNRYCAQCNFKRTEDIKCMPAVVETKLSEGLNNEDIFQYCLETGSDACVHYLMMTSSRGKPYRFASLFDISEKVCIPPRGRRCCAGDRYDFRSKQCRKLH